MKLEEYRALYPEDSAPGIDAINAVLEKRYPDQQPMHYATVVSYRLGGDDPLDGISVYRAVHNGVAYLHFISFGFSTLYYDEEEIAKDDSHYGFELSFRLRCDAESEDYNWALNLLQNLARYVFDSGNRFAANHFIPANSPIKLDSDTALVGLVFALDPELGAIDTAHGRVEFIQMIGITEDELERMIDDENQVEPILAALSIDNPLWITDLARKA